MDAQTMHLAHLAHLQGVCLALLAVAATDHQADSISIEVTREKDGTTAIDLTYSARGVPVAGEGI